MLKLKIGQNFLLLDSFVDGENRTTNAMAFMMGNFKGVNQIAAPLYTQVSQVIRTLDEQHTNVLHLLCEVDIIKIKQYSKLEWKSYLRDYRFNMQEYVNNLKAAKPNLEVKIININAYFKTNEFIISKDILAKLREDENSIASVLPKLNIYKEVAKRYSNIPKELQIIESDIKRLEKENAVCDRKTSIEKLGYLKLIKEAKMAGTCLDLILHKLPIYPSEPLGVVFDKDNFKNNPYLYKAASFIYQGCHFEMPETHIQIDNNFKPIFIDTLDVRFNQMFRAHNWSTVGYPHFGENHFCPGEFNDTMAHGKEYGMEYYFIALKQYLTTANMRDTAGVRVWWYPIYNDDGEMVYCAGMDAMLNEVVRNIDRELYNNLKDLSWEEKADGLARWDYNDRRVLKYGYSSTNYYGSNRDKDRFLELVKEQDIDLYNKIMEGRVA